MAVSFHHRTVRERLVALDVPAPHDQRAASDQLGPHPRRMGRLTASFPHLACRPQQPVVARHAGQVRALVQQDVEHLRRREVNEALGAQHVEDLAHLLVCELVRWRWPRSDRTRLGRRLAAVMRGPRAAHRRARGAGAEHRLDGVEATVDHGCRLFVSSLSASSRSKSSDAFPWISNASLCFANSSSSRSLRRRSRSFSICSAVRLAGRVFGASSLSAPTSRARRHSTMCEESSPPRRNSAPLAPGSVNRSYSSRMASLSSAENRRRVGFAAGSSSPTPPSWARASKAAVVMVIGLRDPVLAPRDGGLQQVSHVSLTEGAAALQIDPRYDDQHRSPRQNILVAQAATAHRTTPLCRPTSPTGGLQIDRSAVRSAFSVSWLCVSSSRRLVSSTGTVLARVLGHGSVPAYRVSRRHRCRGWRGPQVGGEGGV